MIIATSALLLTLASNPAIPPEDQGAPRPTETRADAPEPTPAPHDVRPLDGRHRLEMRFGGWADGLYGGHDEHWDFSGHVHGVFGFEYLNFITNDIGIGVGFTSLVRADGCHECHGVGTAQALTMIPVAARWYPARRLTPFRSVEPYVTVGVGPVFATDSTYAFDHDVECQHDEYSSTRIGTRLGGRVGGGVDFRLGHTFTLGVAGAWNWNTGFSSELWSGSRPGRGEFTVSLGWNFGR